MSILSKVTLGFVLLAALGFWYLAMRTLKTHEAWRTAYNDHVDAVEKAQEKLTSMIEGDIEKEILSLGKLQVALDSALYGRGKVWTNTLPRFDRATGNVQVQVDQPQPHQIEPKMVLSAFQGVRAEDGAKAQYIGEFNVTAVDANNVTLAPSYRPTAERQRVIEGARGPWSLYEVLPADMNEVFAGLTQDQIDELLPPAPRQLQGEANDDFQARQRQHLNLVQEYLQDNKPIDANNPPPPERTAVIVRFKDQLNLTEAAKADLRAIDFGEDLVKSGVVMKVDFKTAEELVRLGLVTEVERRYQRKLRDYSYVLREFHRRLPIVEDQIINLEKDLAYIVDANNIANEHLTEANKQETTLKQELERVIKERDVVTQFHGTLAERLNKVNTEIARLQEENQRLATQLAQRQLEAVQGSPGRSASTTALASPR